MTTKISKIIRSRPGSSLAVAAVVLASAGGAAMAAQRTSSTEPRVEEVAASPGDHRVNHAFPIPEGFVVLGMADDKRDQGTWAWGSTDTEARVLHWRSANGQVTSWTLGNPQKMQLQAGSESGFAVDDRGDVWVGAQMSLVRLRPETGGVTRWDIPAVPMNPLADQLRPPMAKGAQNVRSLDAAAGKVVIAVSGASELITFDQARQQFERDPLPDIGDANDVAILADGTVGIAMRNYRSGTPDTLIIRQRGNQDIVVNNTQSWFVEPAGDRFLAGMNAAALIAKDGRKFPITEIGDRLIPNGAVAMLPDGRVAGTTSDGILIADENAHRQDKIAFPSGDCAPALASRPAPPNAEAQKSEGPSGQRCFSTARFLATDSSGNLYYASSAGSQNVEKVDRNSF